MQIVELLISLLETQAQTLKRLAAFFGEEKLVDILESSPDLSCSPPLPIKRNWIQETSQNLSHDRVYQKLEGCVRDQNLSASLEFHLWAYPCYRAWIEASLDLTAEIQLRDDPHEDRLHLFVEEIRNEATKWAQNLAIPTPLKPAAEQAAQIPWLRLRTKLFQKAGRRSLISF